MTSNELVCVPSVPDGMPVIVVIDGKRIPGKIVRRTSSTTVEFQPDGVVLRGDILKWYWEVEQ